MDFRDQLERKIDKTRSKLDKDKYYKSFWKDRIYNEEVESGEFLHFLKDRYSEVILIPYEYNMIAFTHISNTSPMKTDKRGKFNYWNTFDSKTQEYLNVIKKNLN